MSRTIFVRANTGLTIYAKPSPVVVSPWADDAVELTEIDSSGQYSGVVTDAHQEVYEQAISGAFNPQVSDSAPFWYEPASIAATLVADPTFFTELNEAVWTGILDESYANATAEFTPAQALYEICQTLSEFTISGKSLEVRKRDRSTVAIEYELNSASKATSRTRIG